MSAISTIIHIYDIHNSGLSPTQMTQQYVNLISELDKTIEMVRSFWIESRDDVEKNKNMKRLDELLDERLRLMKARDAAQTVSNT